MARRNSHPGRRRPGNRRQQAASRRGGRSSAQREPDLLREVRRRLGSGDPLDLLAEVSGLLATVDPRRQSPLQRAFSDGQNELPSLAELVRSLAEIDRVETSALLAGIAELASDEPLRARARRHFSSRRHILPTWLRQLGAAEAYRCVEMSDVLGDANDVIVGVKLSDGHELTAVVYIDHNLGTIAKDGFVLSTTIDALVATMREHQDASADVQCDELDPADARARISEAIEHGAITFPPFETDTWPASRPLVEWIVRQLPEGGTGYQRPEWDDEAQTRLTEAFFASDVGRALDDADRRSLFESILWYGTDYGPGDPLRWSPTAVEILLLDWIPRKIVAPSRYLAKAPELLRAFIRYAHAQLGIPVARTDETLAAVDAFEPEYQKLVRSPRPQGPTALLAAVGAINPDGPWELPDDEPLDTNEHMLEILREQVGGEEALASLADDPLPDEPVAWDAIARDIRTKVADIKALCDRCCEELLDVEYRTACRRYLVLVATGDPNVFRRRGSTHTAAAAICWTIGTANELFHPAYGRMRVKDLLAHFGITQGGVSQRAATLMKAAGLQDPNGYTPAWEVKLGTPDLLVSSRRRRIIERRDRYSLA